MTITMSISTTSGETAGPQLPSVLSSPIQDLVPGIVPRDGAKKAGCYPKNGCKDLTPLDRSY